MKDRQRLIVFGATSAICHALLKRYAHSQAEFFLVARDAQKLEIIAADLEARGGSVKGHAVYDFNKATEHENVLAQAVADLGGLDIAMVAHGTLPDQSECELSAAAVQRCMEDNFTSAAVIIQSCAAQLAGQGAGTLAVISSVAGDRGRKSNYFYGAAKSGIDTIVQGLQGRFSGSQIRVVNIKPGMIASPMTAHMQHGAIWSTPEAIAPAIHRAIERGRAVVYVPGYWRLIMLIIRALPAGIMAKLPI